MTSHLFAQGDSERRAGSGGRAADGPKDRPPDRQQPLSVADPVAGDALQRCRPGGGIAQAETRLRRPRHQECDEAGHDPGGCRPGARGRSADSVFVYYAGHGYQMDDTGMGYWIPVDGSVKTAAQWISNTDISRLLGAIPARQLMLVSDSCFSGTLAREHNPEIAAVTPGEVLRKRSVLVLSSGGEEPVSDEGKDGHSIFAWHFSGRSTGWAEPPSASRSIGGEKGRQRGVSPAAAIWCGCDCGTRGGGDYLFEALAK